jgi:cystathionine beta-lyase family protein involved in aluminum resistance
MTRFCLLRESRTTRLTILYGLCTESGSGSLKDFLVNYKQLDLKDGGIDYNGIESVMDKSVKVVFIQRSKGYTADRKTLSCEEIGKAVEIIKAINKNAVVIVDNCYGEFVEEFERQNSVLI